MASNRLLGIISANRLGYRTTGHKAVAVPKLSTATNMVKRTKPTKGGFKGISVESIDFKAPPAYFHACFDLVEICGR